MPGVENGLNKNVIGFFATLGGFISLGARTFVLCYCCSKNEGSKKPGKAPSSVNHADSDETEKGSKRRKYDDR